MKDKLKKAKELLKSFTLDEYNNIIKQARLTDRQKYILQEREKGRFNYQIAMDLCVSPETVRDDIRHIFERIDYLAGKGFIKERMNNRNTT